MRYAINNPDRYNYDNVAEMYLVEFCFLVTLVVLSLALWRVAVPPGVKATGAWFLLFVPISLLVFSFRQWEHMLWGWGITFAFAQTFSVLALYLLYGSTGGSAAT